MKKLFIFIILLLFTFSIRCYAQTVLYVWENTNITMEVHAPLENYLNLPKVTVYAGGNKHDVEIYYSKDYTYATLNTVTTNIVGTYFLDYKAEIPTYGYTSKQRIYFNVVDTTAPKIEVTNKTINLNESIDILKQIKVTDNYSASEKIKVNYVNTLNNKVVGEYRIKVTAADEHNNEAIDYLIINVIDEEAPVIEALFDDIEIDYGTKSFIISEYFQAYDNSDKDLTSQLAIVKNIDFNTLGKQEIKLTVRDSSNNTTEYTHYITIIDKVIPTISLKNYFIEVDVSENLNYEYFKGYLHSVSDNETLLTFEDVLIDFSQVQSARGYYEVSYTVSDNSENEAIVILTVKINYKKEIMASITNVTVAKGEIFNYQEFINIIKDENVDYYITVASHNVNINQIGDYFIDLIIYDSYNNKVNKRMNVKVIDSTKEVVEENTSFLQENIINIVIGVLAIGIIIFLYKKKIGKQTKP